MFPEGRVHVMPHFDLDRVAYGLIVSYLLINCETINDTLKNLDIWIYVNVNSMIVYRYLNYHGYHAT
jgi:hypothetical protein